MEVKAVGGFWERVLFLEEVAIGRSPILQVMTLCAHREDTYSTTRLNGLFKNKIHKAGREMKKMFGVESRGRV